MGLSALAVAMNGDIGVKDFGRILSLSEGPLNEAFDVLSIRAGPVF